MSTYTDLHNKAKETLNVDYHTRVTPQKVHFLNPENTYHGAFIGEGHLKGRNHIVGGTIDHVYLSSAILEDVKFKNGLVLDTIQQTIDQLSADLKTEAEIRATDDAALCAEISTTNLEISTTNLKLDVEKLDRKNADDVLSIELSRRINYEVEQSILRDEALGKRIDDEKVERVSADIDLEKRVNDKMLHDRHLELVNHDNRAFPIKIKDYAVNTYIDSNPEAYVYINGNLDRSPIGRIENSVLDENGNVKSFTFNAFAEHPDTYELTARGRFVYNFDNDTGKTVYTGVGGYRLNCDLAAGKKLDEAQFILDSANNNGFYRAYFNDSKNPAAIINGNCGRDADNRISSCLFTVTSKTLSNFIRPVPFTFDKNGRTLYFTGTDGSDCEITLSDNVFYMYENRTVGYFLPVKNQTDNELFAKIYDDGFKFDADGILSAVHAHLKHHLGYFDLRRSNGFKSQYDDAHPYTFVQYDEANNMLSVVDELIHYEYKLNNDHGTIIPGINDTVNKKIDDIYATLGVNLTLPAGDLAPYVNKDYVLNKDEYSNLYVCEQQITADNFGSIKLIFNKDEYCLKVIIKQNAYQDAHILKLFISDIISPRKIDGSIIKYASQRICEDIRHIKASELIKDDRARNKYIVKADLSKLEYSGEKKVLICYSNTAKKNTLDLFMPNKAEQIPNDHRNASSKFILNFNITTRSLDDDKFVKLNLISQHKEDKFYYTNKPVKNIFILKNKWSTLQFEEIRPHRYVITDLDYSELDNRLNWLRNRLSCHEISSYEHIMKLSDDVEFLLSVDRETMNYKGTLPQMAPKSQYDGVVRLSTFISQSPHLYGGILKLGDMFKLSAPQYGISAIYDKNDISTFLGENDYFIVNSPLISVQDVEWKNLDIFRNSESEYAFLSIELTNQINSTSSYIVSEINRISTELSTELSACELSVNGLSIEVDRISVELSTTLKLSVDELQNQIVSNDVDIAELSDKVQFILSVDRETVNYKGTIPPYTPAHPHDEHNWQLDEYISACISATVGTGKLDVKKGDMFKVGIAPAQAIYDRRMKEEHKVWFGSEDFFIATQDVVKIKDIKVEYIDIFRNAEAEVTKLSIELSTELSACELSVNGLSIEVNRISSELSTELYACELSVNGLSAEVNRISSELSTELSACELSVNGLSNYIDSLELSVNGLSIEVNRISTELSTTLKLSVDELQNQIISNDNDIFAISSYLSNDVVHYKGTVALADTYKDPESHATLDPDKFLFGLLLTNPLINGNRNYKVLKGFIYKATTLETKKYFDVTAADGKLTLTNNAYIIAINDIDTIEDAKASDFTVINDTFAGEWYLSSNVNRISSELSTELSACELSVNGLSVQVNRISSELSTKLSACELSVNGLSIEVNRISAELSTELSACELSVNGLSNYIDSLELSVNGLSVQVNRISSELSTTLKLSVDELQNQIVSNDNDISVLSNKVEFLLSVGHDSMEYKGSVEKYNPTGSLTSNYHISAFFDKIVKDATKFVKNGFMYRLSAVQDTLSDHINNSIKLGINDYLIINKDVYLSNLTFNDIDIIRDSSVEAKQLSAELSTELSACELSVNGLSVQVNRISSELSTELSACELSVNGLSVQVNRISSELSTELSACELSVNGLSAQVNRISAELSTELSACELSVNGLSVQVNRISSELSTTLKLSVDELQNQIVSNDNDIFAISSYLSNDVVHYKGTVALADTYKDPEGKAILDKDKELFGLLITNPLINKNRNYKIFKGFVYKATTLETKKYFDVNAADRKLVLTNNTYIIAINDIEKVEDAKASDFTVINDTFAGEWYLSSNVNRISSELSTELQACELSVNGLSTEVNRISSELSTELQACELSVNGLSIEVDRISAEISNTISRLSIELSTELCACELSVNGLSTQVNRISSEISTTLSLSVDLLQKQIVSNDYDISSISTDLSVLEHHYNKTMSCDLVLEHVKGPSVTDHISAVVDKLLIVDEVTFDLYALTIRNGALNINKVKTITENYHVSCCTTK